MKQEQALTVIARIHTDFPSKFGVPRQSGLVNGLVAQIVFEPGFRDPDALRGIEDFSHLWLLWGFSEVERDSWTPTVRPPRLGGNKRKGVFATRSPFRPNKIGLSSVRLVEVRDGASGKILIVDGADMIDGTPIYDVKPYIPYTDSHPDAVGGFSDDVKDYSLQVIIPPRLRDNIAPDKLEPLTELLGQDPRPSYINDPDRIYGVLFAGMEIKFTVSDGILTVLEVGKHKTGGKI